MGMKSENMYLDTETLPIELSSIERKTIPIVCPWCNRIVKVAKWAVTRGDKIAPTHGICEKCLRLVLEK
ncbi:MAG TPA: hypothetical protein DCZ94_16610 [Lentisphaeria bacterium]|nr:MAG: hypothetical protein A2X48_00190 [Lentisphaerae bacterium GWF2_49_21]HBC88570.1 hypothetical protein [Lentisphaeria bacterium]